MAAAFLPTPRDALEPPRLSRRQQRSIGLLPTPAAPAPTRLYARATRVIPGITDAHGQLASEERMPWERIAPATAQPSTDDLNSNDSIGQQIVERIDLSFLQ